MDPNKHRVLHALEIHVQRSIDLPLIEQIMDEALALLFGFQLRLGRGAIMSEIFTHLAR